MQKAATTKKVSKSKPRGPVKTVDGYLAGLPEPARTTLKKIRATLRAAAPPQATEAISYGIPSLKYKGTLLWFAAFSDHCSLFPTAAVVREFKDDLKPYRTSKGTIHFPVDNPLPASLLKKMIKSRVAQNEGKK